MGYRNAQEIKNRIEIELGQSDTMFFEFRYFRRENGILHIQCNVHGNDGGIQYGYYTAGYENSDYWGIQLGTNGAALYQSGSLLKPQARHKWRVC